MKVGFIFLSCLLAGCAGLDARCPTLPGGMRYCLQPAAEVFSAQQRVELRYRDRQETLIALVEADHGNLQFVGLTPFGQKMVHVHCKGTQVEATLWPYDGVDPASLCALVQLTLWPEDVLRVGLTPELVLGQAGELRTIHRGQALVFEARRIGTRAPYERLEVKLPALDARLDITTLQ